MDFEKTLDVFNVRYFIAHFLFGFCCHGNAMKGLCVCFIFFFSPDFFFIEKKYIA